MYKVEFKKVPGDACTVTRGGATVKGKVLQCVLADKGEKLYFVAVPGQVGRTFAESEIDVVKGEEPLDEEPLDEDFDPDLGEKPAVAKPQTKKSSKKKAKKKK